jgi:acetyl-CoA carboxylase biotin carboxylase subunit
MFGKVLIANRGEIAVRVIRALRELGISSVAVFSDADRTSAHVRMADEAEHIGPSPSQESYLRIDRIIDAARRHHADAIHPGYGFLSENAEFAEACERAGIVFIGPPADAIRRMGSKLAARKLAKAAGAPVVPGTEDPVTDAAEARRVAAELGYPVFVKASAGGGGKGMRLVAGEAELDAALRDAASEAARSFSNPEVYLEKALTNPRHIEIQIMGDRYGNFVHLGERECSIQRRHQKVIEECPSPLVATRPGMREAMGEAAIQVAKAAGYYNAGTIEFLVGGGRSFYFLEMNTRLQVEHPVTELVTGLDLVELQLRVAAGEQLALRQEEIVLRGSAIECRVYAEDPYNNFFPSPGTVTRLERPFGPGIRLDGGVYLGWTIPIEYDPLVGKLAVWASTRDAAITRMIRALDEYLVDGIKTNIGFFRQIFDDELFRSGDIHTGFLDEFLQRKREGPAEKPDLDRDAVAALVGAVYSMTRGEAEPQPASAAVSRWLAEGRDRRLQT